VHARFSSRDDDGIHVFFSFLQKFKGGSFLKERRLRVSGYSPVVAESTT
jgi:hypothetical protein